MAASSSFWSSHVNSEPTPLTREKFDEAIRKMQEAEREEREKARQAYVNEYLKKLEYPERMRKIMAELVAYEKPAKVIHLNPISKQAELWPKEAMAVIAILVNRLGGYVEINAKEIIDIDMEKVKTGRVVELDAFWIEVE